MSESGDAMLREALDTIEAQAERIRVLEADGPQMRRGSHGDGSDWMGSMRECLNDAMQAASVEANLGDEARAEVKQLRERVRVLREALQTIINAYDAYRGRGVSPAPTEYGGLVDAIHRARAALEASQ